MATALWRQRLHICLFNLIDDPVPVADGLDRHRIAGWLSIKKIGDIAKACIWSGFIFAILSTIGAVSTETRLPEPKAEKAD